MYLNMNEIYDSHIWMINVSNVRSTLALWLTCAFYSIHADMKQGTTIPSDLKVYQFSSKRGSL